MEEEATGILTDKRRTYTFYVDDVVLDVFGPRIGAYGIAVYTLLARHAKKKECFPSYRHIMKQVGISRMTLWRTIDVLIKEGLIKKVQRESAYGDLTSSLYVLLDLSQYHDHGDESLAMADGSTCEVLPSITGVLPSITGVLPSITGVLPSITEILPFEGISSKGSHLRGEEKPLCLPTEDISPQKKTRKGKALDYSPGFVAFWEVYPHARRTSKPGCMERWQEANLESRTAEITEKVERLKITSWLHIKPTYIPLAKTWLNDRRYEDDLMDMPVPVIGNGRLSEKEQRTAENTVRVMERYYAHAERGDAAVLRQIE